jgi:hypothetical protein
MPNSDTYSGIVNSRSESLYEVRPRKDHRGVDLISDVLPFGQLCYGGPNAASYAMHYCRSHDAVICVYDEAGNVIETHEHAGEFKERQTRQTKSRHTVKRDG